MQSLIQKIEASAATRLTLPPGHSPSQELARFRTFLKVETHRLKILHQSGADGRQLCQARAVVLDVLLRHLLEGFRQSLPAVQKCPLPVLALVAIGGYGRQELNPHSDIDIMFLHDGEVAPHGRHRGCMVALTEGYLTTLYDLGMKVGHSVRTIDDCVKVANSDMQSKTSLIEARLITGDTVLFDRMQRTVLAKCVMGFEDDYIAARLKDQGARRAKYGDSACMQEPNIKNGCGGLRDYQNLLWMAFFKYRIRTLADLQERELISETERRQLEEAYDFLLRVRTALHYQAGRTLDVLLKNAQPAVALSLGFTERSMIRRLERFMRELYVHLRNVYLITRTLEQRLALQKKPGRFDSFRQLFQRRRAAAQPAVDGFTFAEGEILPASPRVFRDQPRRLMRVFLHAQQRGLKLHPDLAQLIRNQLTLVDRAFLRDAHVRETFLEILNQRGNVAPVLRTMHEVGLLGRFVPEFGKLTCLVQHEFFHRYTADEHTLVCMEMLDSIWAAKIAPFSHFTALFQQTERPYLIYLALLLHDAGKADPNTKHARRSADLAMRAGKRLGLETAAIRSLHLVIEHHLSMIQISQRRDLDDPAVARHFAHQIQTLENLDRLVLITFADSLGTSMALWNDFKESLLWTLYDRTAQVLRGGTAGSPMEARQREALVQEVRRVLPKSLQEDELQAHFTHLPSRYFQIRTANEMAAELALVHRFLQLQTGFEERALEPVSAWQNEPDRGHAVLRLCTWDRSGLFSKIAGSLTAANLNILSAQIFSRGDGIIIDTFFVTEALTGRLPSREEREKFEQVLKSALAGQVDLASLMTRQRTGRMAGPYLEGESIPTVVRFDNATSDTRTVIEVETEDRVGLLFAISRALSELGLDISTSKICTEKGAAIDTFYVSELNGSKIQLTERLQDIEDRLRAAINQLDLV